MFTQDTPLKIVPFTPEAFNSTYVAERLTALKARATRTPTIVTPEQLQAIADSPTNVLLLQIAEDDGETILVGFVHIAIVHLEDRALIGPIAIDEDSTPRGHGTPLMETAIEYVKNNFPSVRRIDLTNRPSHDHAAWYQKFGFVGRTEENGDPTTVYRLTLS